MEAVIVLILLAGVALLVLPVILLINHGTKIRALEASVSKLTARLAKLENGGAPQATAAPAPATAPAAPVATHGTPPVEIAAPPAIIGEPPAPPAVAAVNAPAPFPQTPPRSAAVPPPLSPLPVKSPTPPPTRPIDWEAFFGVKLFAWLGGFVLFLGVVFLVKYSFENNLITPAMRVVIGAIIGLTLIASGWLTGRRNYRVPGQSLCATGVLVLYADIFGAHAFYGLISLTTAFLMMSAVTCAAFLLAVQMEAQVVVVLGLVGGFLTPPLLTRGDHNTLLLFGYVALLNAGISAVAIRQKWDYLLSLGAIGTVITQWAWLPLDATRASAGFYVFLLLQVQFLVIACTRQRTPLAEKWSTPAALALGFSSLGFALYLLSFARLATWPAFFFSYVFLADVGLLALAFLRPNPSRIAGVTGAAVFTILAGWTAGRLEHQLLWWALGAYVLFAVIHAGFSVWPKRETPTLTATDIRWRTFVPLLALGLLFICVARGETSFAVWVCVLIVNLFALAIAWRSASLLALVIALFATIATVALWILTAPPIDASSGGMLAVIGGFGVFFSVGSTLLARRLGIGSGDSRRNVPAIAAAMPFVLLMMLIAKLPVSDPTAVFTVALILAVVLLGLGILARTSWIAVVALGFAWAVEREWHALHFTNAHALLALGWCVVCFVVFAAYPFFSKEEESPVPWAVGAMSGVLHFWLIYGDISAAYPHLRGGLLPAIFVLPYAFGVFHLIRKRGVAPASGDARLAWQGGAALLFLSLIFPIQFQCEWITLGWALEGLALLVLFRRVPNRWLGIVGTALLCVAFVRLALNPAVFDYHPRAAMRIWNWYVYAYGITIFSLFAGARMLEREDKSHGEQLSRRLLYVLGTILTFLLLNIEIADYFSVGPTLTFSFSGNFARDMTYSIAWALFAFGLLLAGMRGKAKAVRYAGLALLLVTLGKLFFHDLGNLNQLYRIGAFIGVALILIVASFVYQRFLKPTADSRPADL
ncbi:hypothetical protein BH18VER1_BH18VER1_19390 [soil metagenome]